MKNVLVTGGLGKIGRHFVETHKSDYAITVADLESDPEAFGAEVRVEQADLMDLSTCKHLCQSIDTVVHLAGIVDPDSESDEILDINMATTRNIFKSAVEARCRRIIFASSAQTIEGYSTDTTVNTHTPVRPKNLYGVTKCFGEALAAYYAFQKNISIFCLRIGAYEFPEDYTEMNARDLSAYLHPDDFNQLLIRCIENEGIQYEVLNAISDNRFKRLDIKPAMEKVGYAPKADAFELFALAAE